MLSVLSHLISFILGGMVGAPIMLWYGYYLVRKYVNNTEVEIERVIEPDLAGVEEELDLGIVSKVGWLKVTHSTDPSPEDSNNNLTDLLSNSLNNFLDRKPTAAPKRHKGDCYAVLKGDKLMIYESGQRQECRGIILMTQYCVEIYPTGLADNEVFKKELPIRLKPSSEEDGDSNVTNEYYIYASTPVEKEAWFIALIHASDTKTDLKKDPLSFDKTAIESLLTTINSNPDHEQTKWLNALIGRIFLGIYKTDTAKQYFIHKITTKTTKVKKPGFLGDIIVRDLSVGTAVPYITNPKLISLSKDGELTAEMDLGYEGGFKAEIETEATLQVSARLKPLKVNMVLAVVLKSLSGKVLLRVKPPPTNRFWIGFYDVPKLDLSIEPMVSDTQIKSSMVLSAIEKRILDLFKEAMVLPNMDDFCFFPSYGSGGIFNPVSEDLKDQVEKKKEHDQIDEASKDISDLQDPHQASSSAPPSISISVKDTLSPLRDRLQGVLNQLHSPNTPSKLSQLKTSALSRDPSPIKEALPQRSQTLASPSQSNPSPLSEKFKLFKDNYLFKPKPKPTSDLSLLQSLSSQSLPDLSASLVLNQSESELANLEQEEDVIAPPQPAALNEHPKPEDEYGVNSPLRKRRLQDKLKEIKQLSSSTTFST